MTQAEFRELVSDVEDRLQAFVSFTSAARPRDSAVTLILNQASNEFADLLVDAEWGRGRPAIKTTRSLFELLVTLLDVMSSDEMSRRYLAHQTISKRLWAQVTIDAQELGGDEARNAERRRKRVLRETERRRSELLQEFGKRFEKQWAGSDLRARATKHGLAQDYGYYALTSSILHGTAGAVRGHERKDDRRTIRRVGHAYSLCPLALLQGLRFFTKIVRTAGDEVGGREADALLASLAELRISWPRYRKALLRLDEETWPSDPPPGGGAVLGIIPITGHEQWFYYSGPTHELYEADPPKLLSEAMSRVLSAWRAKVKSEAPLETGWITTIVEGADVQPRRGARPLLPEQVLVRRPIGGWSGFPTPDDPVELELTDDGRLIRARDHEAPARRRGRKWNRE